MTLILTDRPTSKEIPRNQPAPTINPRLQQKLAQIGGIVPEGGGRDAGQPVYRLAFGQVETHFSRGKQRLRFPDPEIAPVTVQERFFVTPEVFSRAAAWQSARERKRLERFLSFDYTIFANNEPLSGYLRENEAFFDYLQLENAVGDPEEISNDVVGLAAVDAPSDWIYLCDVKEVIEIGKACWYVMRWIPSSSHGGRKQWNDLRYSFDAYVPEINAVVPVIDDLGEYPETGFWIPRLEIAEYVPDENGRYSGDAYRYTTPTEANCVQPVVEMLYERAKLTNQDQDRKWRDKQNEDRLIAKRDAGINANLEAAKERFGVV